MSRRRARIPLNVYLNARLVGSLRRLASGAIDFRYDRTWLEWEHALPISMSLPLREDRYGGDAVVAVFDNLLPDSEPVRRRIAERVRAEGNDAYSLLARIGRDCVGALQFLPEGQEPGAAGVLEGREVGEDEIARKLRDLARAPLAMDGTEEFRLSIAGVQEKTAFLYWKGRWHIPHGTTATTHILKPRIGMLPSGLDLRRSVENEHLCLKLATALGLPSREHRDRRLRWRARPGDRAVRPYLDERRAAAVAPPAGRLLSGSVGAAVPQVRRRWRPRHGGHS